MTTTSLDDLILSAATKEPQKSAVLISKVFDNPAFDKETNKAQGRRRAYLHPGR